MRRPVVELVEYDPTWPDRTAAAIAELEHVLPGVVAEIEHIGSTAVPGLAAEPIIDLMAAVTDLTVVERYEQTLADQGYRRHFNGMADRLLYVRTVAGVRTEILHAVTLESWPTRNQRILRDYLRRHPREARDCAVDSGRPERQSAPRRYEIPAASALGARRFRSCVTRAQEDRPLRELMRKGWPDPR